MHHIAPFKCLPTILIFLQSKLLVFLVSESIFRLDAVPLSLGSEQVSSLAANLNFS